jgi:hypothetical protein
MRLTLVFVLLTSCATVASATAPSASPTTGPPGGRFSVTCGFNLGYSAQGYPIPARVQVDPIVAPGKQVSAHMHDFYGEQEITDYMFASANWPLTGDVVAGYQAGLLDPGYQPKSTSCPYSDWSAYWYPSPKFNGAFTNSSNLTVTWQSPDGVYVATGPFGETFVVGNSLATSEASEPATVSFNCGNIDGPQSPKPVDCTGKGKVTAQLLYPDCWDGNDMLPQGTGANPAGIAPSHFTYGSPCPSGTQPMAQMVTRQTFIDPRTYTVMVNPFNADGTLGLSFSSGPYYTYHGDFISMWSVALKILTETCLNHRLLLADRGGYFHVDHCLNFNGS